MAMKQTININTADIKELMTLKDIGQKRAQLIMSERTKLGTLTSETLKAIEGILSNIWDPLIFTGKVIFEEQIETKDPEIEKNVQPDNQQVTELNELVGKQKDQLEQQEKVIEDYKTKLMIADQDKKSMQQDMKKQLSDVQNQCSAQLTAKTEELEEVLDSMQKSKINWNNSYSMLKLKNASEVMSLNQLLRLTEKNFNNI
ncbi:comEA [Mytilus coruscus]|uniref:ComEA n=1 Tax=Mytilus coruscus TaxID=42192 RepID=A0A6J8AHV8_MYTCO|nr:comEA [Mytilus coruscus]